MDATSLVAEVESLFSLPQVCQQLSQLLHDEMCEEIELAELISYDPVLSAKLMGLANGADYPGQAAVRSVSEAIARVGADGLRTLLAESSSADTFARVNPTIADMDDFWHHSVCCALASESVARQAGMADPEQLFIAGLMHDIGQLVIYHTLPDLAEQVLRRAGELESHRYQMEKEVMGLTHAAVGRALLQRWQLPEMVQQVVEFHHEPERADAFVAEASVVHIGTALANCVEPSWKMNGKRPDAGKQIRPFAWQTTGLSPDIIGPTVSEVSYESISVLTIVDPSSMSIY